MKLESVTVRVPASTSNLGSGFDTLGLALKLYNRVQVARVANKGLSVVLSNPEANADRAQRMLSDAAGLFFRRSRRKMFGIAVKVTGDLPVGRGLGASATARLGLVAALNELSRARLTRQQLLEI